MITIQRQEEILRILQEKKTVTVGYLAELLYVSLPTIRRDLAKLESCLLYTSSFANCLAPFLAAHFREIDLIDLRYYRPSGGLSLLEDTSADQILFVYSLDDLVEDPNFIWLAP